jgi:hypothetical protein
MVQAPRAGAWRRGGCGDGAGDVAGLRAGPQVETWHGVLLCTEVRSGLAWPGIADPGLDGHLDGVPGAAQRRGVGQVQVTDRGNACRGRSRWLRCRRAWRSRRPLAEQLHLEGPTGGPVTGDAHRDAVAARIVGLVVVRLACRFSCRVRRWRGRACPRRGAVQIPNRRASRRGSR